MRSLPAIRSLSPRNPRVARLHRLAHRRDARREEGAFLIEGPTLVSEALQAGLELQAVFVCETGSAGVTAAVRSVAAQVASAGVPVWELPPAVLARAVDVVTPQAMAAVATTPQRELDPAGTDLVLILDGVADPGNAGTLLRVAEACSVGAVVFGGETVDPYNPKCVRASAGAVFRVSVVQAGSTMEAVGQLAAAGHRVVAARADAALPYDALDYTDRVSFVLGSEAHGLSGEVERASELVSIPMAGRLESLNVAIAGAVLCFEAARQRRAAAGPGASEVGSRP